MDGRRRTVFGDNKNRKIVKIDQHLIKKYYKFANIRSWMNTINDQSKQQYKNGPTK